MVIHMGDIFPAGYWVSEAGCLQFGSYPLICKTKFWTMQKLGVEFHFMLCQVCFSTSWSWMIGGLRNGILPLAHWLTIDWQLHFWGDFVIFTELGWELLEFWFCCFILFFFFYYCFSVCFGGFVSKVHKDEDELIITRIITPSNKFVCYY